MEKENNITFGKLPTRDACYKLLQVSFSTPQKNLSVYRFYKKIFELLDFIDKEWRKIVQKYGDPTGNDSEHMIPKCRQEEFEEEMKSLFATSVDDIPSLGLTEDDFENCKYPNDEKLWLNAGEIMTFLKF